jgi:hypothetical protein
MSLSCAACGSDQPFSFLDYWGEHDYTLIGCCDATDADLADFDEWPADVRRLVLDAAAAEVGLPRVRSGEVALDFKLDARPVTQKRAFAMIDAKHRHHDAPVGWKFGVGVWNGPTLVGVVAVGRPVNRNMQARGFYEVTRGCVHADWPYEALARHAASKLYAEAIKRVKKLGVGKLMTYTLEQEDGRSFAHLGFERVWLTKGGSWDTPGRRRTDKAPTGKKWLWVYPAAAARALTYERLKPMLKHMTLDQFLDLWTDLEQAYHGKHRHGGDTAEIYTHRLMPGGRMTSAFVPADTPEYKDAVNSFDALLDAFVERHPGIKRIEIETADDRFETYNKKKLYDRPHRFRLRIDSSPL